MNATLRFITQHPLTRQRPFSALARYARWQLESRIRGEIEFDWIEGSKLLVRNGMTGATGNIYCGLHEFADMGFVLHFLRPEDLFVDVGANIGSYTVLGAAVIGASVVAVEPDEIALGHLRSNVALNVVTHRVDVQPFAVGAVDGVVSFTVGRDTMNQVVANGGQGTHEVPVRRLDALLNGRGPALIKLDVEGYEAEALAGAEFALSSPSLLAIESEGRAPEVLQTMRRHGFEEMFYDPFKRALVDHPVWPQSNGLFVRHRSRVKERLCGARRINVLGQFL